MICCCTEHQTVRTLTPGSRVTRHVHAKSGEGRSGAGLQVDGSHSNAEKAQSRAFSTPIHHYWSSTHKRIHSLCISTKRVCLRDQGDRATHQSRHLREYFVERGRGDQRQHGRGIVILESTARDGGRVMEACRVAACVDCVYYYWKPHDRGTARVLSSDSWLGTRTVADFADCVRS